MSGVATPVTHSRNKDECPCGTVSFVTTLVPPPGAIELGTHGTVSFNKCVPAAVRSSLVAGGVTAGTMGVSTHTLGGSGAPNSSNPTDGIFGGVGTLYTTHVTTVLSALVAPVPATEPTIH